MTRRRAARGDVRERNERDARFFAWDVPGDAHIVALVHDAEEGERSATVADAIATSVARRREHTLLLSADPGPSPLDELLGAAESRGLPAALEGRVRLTDVAVQRPDRPFVYLPAGPDPVAMRSLLEAHLLASFVDRVRARGGTLFIVLSDDTLEIEPLRSLLDGYVALGDVSIPESAGSLAQFGRVRFEADLDEAVATGNGGAPRTDEGAPEPGASPAASTSDEESGDAARAVEGSDPQSSDAWRRHRKTRGFPIVRVGAGLAAVIVIVVAWWMFASGRAGAGSAEAAAGSAAPSSAGESPTLSAPAFDADAARTAFERAPELSFSVLMASFTAPDDAAERLGELRADGPGFFFTAPTPIRGIIYHRVFAGAVETRDQAQALMDDLVASGRKEEAGAWHLRPSNLAFALGVYEERASAERRIADLAAAGLSAYALTAPFEGGTAWRVYAGAYNSEPESEPMAEMLRDAGEPAELTARRGSLPPP